MNILELQDNLKDVSDDVLMREMQMPSGNAPQFLILSELKRRKRMRDEFQRREAEDISTVAEETITAAGMPQQGIMQAARAIAPNTNMAQNTGMNMAAPVPATRAPQMMADGGVVKMQQGGGILSTFSPAIIDLSLSGTYGLDTQREIAGLAITGQFGSEKQAQVLSEALSGVYGDDIKRRAEQANALLNPQTTPQITTSDPSSGFFPNDANLATVGGEGIGSVSKNIEDFAVAPLADERRDDDPELPEDPLRPRTGFGSNPAYTYETFLEENQINDTPQAQEMFINYKNYMNKRGPASDPKIYSPFLDDSPELKSPVDSGKLPSISSMDEELAANTLYPEGIGTAVQEFLKQQNAGFGDISGGFDPIPYLSSISKDAEQRALAEAGAETKTETDEYTFMGDVLPFLGRAGLAAGKSLYENTLKPEPLLEVGAVPNKREVLEGRIADINQQILDAEQANDETLVNALITRKNVLMRRLDAMEFTEDAGEVLRGIPGQFQDVGSSIYQTFNEQVLAGVDPRLAAANIKASQDAVATRELENKDAFGLFPRPDDESEAEREARIDALRGDATEVVPGISTEVSGFFPNLEMENPNIGDSTTPAPKVTTDDDTTNVKSITDGGEDDAGFGSTDSRIAKMLADRQKEAESDKWMALAYAGFKLMEPTATIGEGFGKAGQAGLGYLTKAKKGLRDFETDMLKLQTTLDAARLRSQRADKTSATAYAALERSYSEALELATQNPSAPNLARLKELEDLVRAARAVQFGAVTADNTNSGVIKTPSAQTG
jgi:hypothetical protein